MGSPRRLAEMEFELSLTSALEDGHGLNVRVDGDVLNRRRNGYATLAFRYEYPNAKSTEAEVYVTIVDADASWFRFSVDLAERDDIDRAAGECEALALAVYTHLDDAGKPLELVSQGNRWDD